MRYNTLGNTGLLVSEICLGTMTFSEGSESIWKSIAGVSQTGADELLKLPSMPASILSIRPTPTPTASPKLFSANPSRTSASPAKTW